MTQSATQNPIWSHMQRGLIYPSPHAIYAIFFRSGKPLTKDVLTALLRDLRKYIHDNAPDSHTSAVAGVGIALWREWSNGDLPAGFPAQDTSEIFARSNTYADSRGDLWFHIKSDRGDYCASVLDFISKQLADYVDAKGTISQDAARKTGADGQDPGKVIGCRFSENLNNATDPLSLQQNVLIEDDTPHRGGSYVFAQRFHLNWDHILNMTPEQIEDLVGRTTSDVLIPSPDTRSHIKCARVQDGAGDTLQILRLSLPFGESPALKNNDLVSKGANLRDEAGIFFAAYASTVGVFEQIVNSQIGPEAGLMRDRLLSEVRADAGGFFYVPSRKDLDLKPEDMPKAAANIKFYPGMDWSLLDRHFNKRSSNGLMFYNHKDYLYVMQTAAGDDRKRLDPPSQRVLTLIANAFSRWQDNWYFDRKQQELKHLCAYVAEKYGPEKAREVMNLSIAERMGWTVKVSLGDVFASKEYGFRGRKLDADGNYINGADTYHIHPLELIVGALPNIGLGQGRYVIDYARKDEEIPNFFVGLSYASGVGHTVPMYERALDKGIGGMLDEVSVLRDGATDTGKKQFYAGVALSLEGVRDHCLAYARLAKEMNLPEIEARMTKLATQKPETMLEAAQLIFTLHSCLHLIGEPTAIGRLDQLLAPFYDGDEETAQEIIDCFWIKVGEKVQLNRTMVEDHQPFGNLAMGGMSGNYPQGGANNQWIQQVTVGGTVADDSSGDGKPAYNDITLFCIRAARRLPLNAPCLSLRTRRDMPEKILREAALALLSGGAHPILLCDEKVIPGLVASGEGVGDGIAPTDYTPVREKANGTWDSTVPLRHARDYACDGCYEPQLSGVSWFTLGGLTTPQVLEAALNQGKAWASAGPIWFRGQRISFTSEPPTEIDTFDQLVDLFFKHLRWMWAKQADGTIGVFGQMSAVCPSPLLSALTGGCLEKGLDYYAGGPLFNVIAPGFTGLSTTIDSLWAIKKMVFDPLTANTSLPQLVEALLCNWGENMVEPFVSVLEGPSRIAARAESYRKLRGTAMAVPKFGHGNRAVDSFGGEIMQRVAQTAREVFTDPVASTAQKMVGLAQKLGTTSQPFGGFLIQPGVGTFENYVEFGSMCGASADGRHNGDTIASDLSVAPGFADLPPSTQATKFLTMLNAYTGHADGYSDGAPTDFTIHEDFDVDDLTKCLRAFADGAGSNILTVTCANPDTMSNASVDPEMYDVLRVRMGGWTEVFVAMFPAHQDQHERRPVASAETR